MTTYLKIGAIVGAILAVFAFGYRMGGNSAKTAAETAHAAQLSAVATAYQNQVLAAQASEAKLQTVENAYDAIKDIPDPVSTGLAQRVLLAACPAGGGDVPAAAAVARGTPDAAAQPGGDPGIGGRLQAVLDACAADAQQMSAMIELAPR